MSRLHGFMFPRSATGISSLLPAPPWHYSGQMLTIEYRTDPAAVAELLPDATRPGRRRSGRRRRDLGRLAELRRRPQRTARPGARPVHGDVRRRALPARAARPTAAACYIWVDKDFAMVRGHFQGYPKKLGELYLTRPDHPGSGRAAARARRTVRGDLLGRRASSHRRHVHHHRQRRVGRLRQQAPDAPLAAGCRRSTPMAKTRSTSW